MRIPLDEEQTLPENEVLTAEITSIKKVTKPWTDNKTGEPAERIAWEFTFLDEGIAGRKHWEDLFTSFYPGDKCPMYRWTLKLLNRESLPEDFILDTDAFEGMKVPVILKTRHFTKRDGTPGSALDLEVLSDAEAEGLRAGGASAGTSEATSAPAGIQPLSAQEPVDLTEEPF